ncbi:hypothetical protein QTP86_022157, partial [Hemibagrus guttatus]
DHPIPDSTDFQSQPSHHFCDCPGTSSEAAGKSSACQGCPNQAICSSGAPKAPDPAVEEIKLKMSTVKHKIVVLSGKGGVGKSTFSAHLAHALASDEATEDRFECTDWNMFREAATNSDSINLEEYTTSVTSYIGKRIDDMTVSKTITTHSNRKLWMNAERRLQAHVAEDYKGTNYKTTPSACDSDSSLPDTLNDFYDRFEAQNNVVARKPIPPPNDQVLCLSTADVRRTLCRVNSRKSAGPDNIPGRVLRECAEQLADVFTDIFNISLTSAVVPTCLRTTTIVPVPKKSTFAYRPNCSTDDAITTTLHLSLTHLDNKDTYVRMLFINFSSAFNTIIPQHLIEKLSLLDLNTSLCNWILDFLIGRPVTMHSSNHIVKFTDESHQQERRVSVQRGAENFTWSLNTSSITKKAQQRLYVRQRLRKANLPPPILTVFYRGTIESVALLDVDICGPSIPRIMGLEGEQVHQSGSGWSPVYVEDNLAVMSIGFLLSSPDDAVIWRGPKKNGMIKQFLRDVDWGELDYLIVDTPPGTSDEHLSVVQYLSGAGIDGAVVITTPQEVSLQDVRKEIRFCQKVKLPIIGVVENMSGFVCPKCKANYHCRPENTSQIFPPSTGGAERMCQELSLPLLGRVPLDPRIGRSCDEGKSFLNEVPDSPAAAVYRAIVQSIKDYCASSSASDGNLNTDME